MIVGMEPVAAPRLGFTCNVTPGDDEDEEHTTGVNAFVIVHLKLPIGVIKVPMCTACLGDLVAALQGGDRVIAIDTIGHSGDDW